MLTWLGRTGSRPVKPIRKSVPATRNARRWVGSKPAAAGLKSSTALASRIRNAAALSGLPRPRSAPEENANIVTALIRSMGSRIEWYWES